MPDNPDIVCSHNGMFLGYHGRELPLPAGWMSWNVAGADGRPVASMAVSVGGHDHIDWDEADYDGPFFFCDGAGDMIAVFHCIYIRPALRSTGLWQRYEDVLHGLGLPVYAPFANERLRERFMRRHRPLVPVA